jgi:hypothetical protein
MIESQSTPPEFRRGLYSLRFFLFLLFFLFLIPRSAELVGGMRKIKKKIGNKRRRNAQRRRKDGLGFHHVPRKPVNLPSPSTGRDRRRAGSAKRP